MEEIIVKEGWEMLAKAFPPQSVIVIIGLAVINVFGIRTLWKALQKKEKDLIAVSTKAVEVFEKVEQVYESNSITDGKLNKIITTLEILKDRVNGGNKKD